MVPSHKSVHILRTCSLMNASKKIEYKTRGTDLVDEHSLMSYDTKAQEKIE